MAIAKIQITERQDFRLDVVADLVSNYRFTRGGGASGGAPGHGVSDDANLHRRGRARRAAARALALTDTQGLHYHRKSMY